MNIRDSFLTSYLNAVSKKDDAYQATKLHFENLAKRYGNPIIILNLIKVYLFIYCWTDAANVAHLSFNSHDKYWLVV